MYTTEGGRVAMLQLTQEQAEHLHSAMWLLNGPRGCGKTLVTAYALLLHAIDSKEKVPLIALGTEYSPGNQMHLIDSVHRLAEQMGVPMRYNYNANEIWVDPSAPIPLPLPLPVPVDYGAILISDYSEI
jgi:hypothetical protein